MAYDIYTISSYTPRKCGIAKFTSNLIGALKHGFTAEIASVEVFPIDESKGIRQYDPLTEVPIIDQFDEKSWIRTASTINIRASERENKPIVIMQHEFGLDGKDAKGKNYVRAAKILKSANMPIFTYLHTLLKNPNKHQKEVTQELSEQSTKIIVPTQSAIKILEDSYRINESKIKHIDHGIRLYNYNKNEIKKRNGIGDIFTISTIGFKSLDKGIEYGIEAYGKFIKLHPEKREKTIYFVAGEYPEDFVKSKNGKLHKKHLSLLEKTLNKSELKSANIESLKQLKDVAKKYDVIYLDKFVSEETLKNTYGITNIRLLPSRNHEQISSGGLADTLGFGNAIISTKFPHSIELLSTNTEKPVNKLKCSIEERGILIDLELPRDEYGLYTPSVKQLVEGLEYLVFNEEERFKMETKAFERGIRMNWRNVAYDFIQLLKIETQKSS